MTPVRLRDVDACEIDAVMTVMERAFDPAFGEAWSRGQCLGLLCLPDVWLMLAEDRDARPLGFALSRMTGDDAELLLLAVDPVGRGRGIATALIARTAAAARQRGAPRLLLEVRESNGALALYRREGFAEIGRRPGYYRGAGGHVHDAITLACALSSSAPSLYPALAIPSDRRP